MKSEQSSNIKTTYFVMSPRFVGFDMAKEVAEVYWFQNHFVYANERYLRRALTNDLDPFGLGTSVVDRICRNSVGIDMPASHEFMLGGSFTEQSFS